MVLKCQSNVCIYDRERESRDSKESKEKKLREGAPFKKIKVESDENALSLES